MGSQVTHLPQLANISLSDPTDERHLHVVIERIAETIDKMEEDVLQTKTASIRCRRSATIEFGEALEVPTTKSRDSTSRLTEAIESRVLELIMKGWCNSAPPVARNLTSIVSGL